MDVRPIHTEEDLTWALNEVVHYFEHQPAPGTPEAARFEVLNMLIEAYENEHWPIPDVDPIAVLEYAIEDMGKSQAELSELLGSRSRASEILSRKRPLTLDMIRTISTAWKLPIEALAAPYKLAENKKSKAKPRTTFPKSSTKRYPKASQG